ncbi:MAG TPA: hypothetical protein VEH57_04630 [Thermoplasmata archaeon]|nr:hypothetical protein [Thermoplasmata archaeon]
MPDAAGVKRLGRRGRRTGTMVRIARERVDDLFALAEKEAASHHRELSDRYVRLARRIGMRYNVRLLSEYRELYCRACSSYWVEGTTVRTRFRDGRRVRTCLVCGRQRRTPVRRVPRLPAKTSSELRPLVAREDEVLVGPVSEVEEERPSEEEPEQE